MLPCLIYDSWRLTSIQEHFFNSLHILVTKKKKVSLTIEEGWFSETELRDEIGWKQFLPYLVPSTFVQCSPCGYMSRLGVLLLCEKYVKCIISFQGQNRWSQSILYELAGDM